MVLRMVKKLVIEAVLVRESQKKQSEEIEREILNEIRYGSLVIPWCDEVVKVRVVRD